MKTKLLPLVLGVAILVGNTATAQRSTKPKQPKAVTYAQKVEIAAKAADKLCADVVDAQRKWLASFSTSATFKNLAGAIISWDEKIAQGNDLFGSNDNTQSRMAASFRQHVADDRLIHDRFAAGVKQLQEKLMTDTYLLFRESGRKLSDFPQKHPNFVLKETAFRGVFDGLFRRSAALARSDWARELTATVGSFAAGSVTRSLAEETGLVTPNSWAAMFFELAADAVAKHAIDQIHDPAGEIGKRLKKDYDAVCNQIINEAGGFENTCRYIVQQHLQFRAKLLGLNSKGGK